MKFSQIIDRSFIGRFVDKKVHIWDELNPEKFYVENIRKFFGISTRLARIICNLAVRQGAFIRKYELHCPTEGRAILEFNDKSEIPKTINCKNCEMLEREHEFDSGKCQILEFYVLVK